MRPYLVTAPEARRLPRLALVGLLLLYIAPGFIGRDPWRSADAIGFGIAHAMFSGGSAQWFLLEVAGSATAQAAPLAYWIAAATARALHAISLGAIDAAAGIRCAAAAWLAGALLLLRAATRVLAMRPEAQPLDPFGAGAGPSAYGQSIADAAFLLALASFGLIARVHETTADAAMLPVSAGFAYGLVQACTFPRRGACLTGVAIAAAALVHSPGAGLSFCGAFLLALLKVRALRLNLWTLLPLALTVALALTLPWPTALALDASAPAQAQLQGWLNGLVPIGTPAEPGGAAAAPRAEITAQLAWLARTLPWFFWPAWPLALRTLWNARERWGDPAVGIPLAMLVGLSLGLGLGLTPGRTTEASLIPLTVPLIILAALGLPTLARSLTRLLDWFSVATFSVFGLGIWGWWLAGLSGWPPKPAAQSVRFAAGFPGFGPASTDDSAGFLPIFGLALAAGILVSGGWLALVRWRLGRHPSVVWRPVVLAGAGMTLAWVLLMTLWMPIFNWRNTYRDVSAQLARALPVETQTPDGACIAESGLDLAQRASFAWFSGLRFRPREGSDCAWLLVAGRRGQTQEEPGQAWVLQWEGGRRSDRNERLRLYHQQP